MSLIRMFFAVGISLILPLSAFAFGPHDDLKCVGCHSIHIAKDDTLIFAVSRNKTTNPRTNKPYTTITALCLGCHQTTEKGGMGIKPIEAHISHPFGLDRINPRRALVPEVSLRNGKFECVACHDPHPSNPNYKYLRYDPGPNGSEMDHFCAACHPMKVDPKAVSVRAFNSMDERLFKGETSKTSPSPAETSPVIEPEKKKKK